MTNLKESIFLAPRSNETSYKNFLSTIEGGVDFSIIEPYLEKKGRKILSNNEKIFAWGTKKTTKSKWDKMKEGDWVLFYKGGSLVYAGKMIFKQHSKDLSVALWPPKPNEEPWECVFFLDDLQPVNIPMTDMNSFAGYKPNYIVQGFSSYNEKGTNSIIQEYENIENFLKKYSTNEELVFKGDLESTDLKIAHTEAQMLLLKIGKMLGYDTFSPDKSPEAYGESLSKHITLNRVPGRFFGDEIISLVNQIDVIWFRDDVPVFAFEVEHTTGVLSGLQRLNQLEPFQTKLFIVAPEKDRRLYDKYIDSDPYYRYKHRFGFRNYVQLEKFFKDISEFSKLEETFLYI